MDMTTQYCARCKEREGHHKVLMTVAGTLTPFCKVWYCDPCYQYLKQQTNNSDIRHGLRRNTNIVSDVPPKPLEVPATLPTLKFVGDKPLPDILSMLSDGSS
jgi:hypothetical protein